MDGAEPKSWLESYFDLFPGGYVRASIITSILFFLLGLAISSLIGFSAIYIRTFPIYLGVFGIAWVGSWAGWGSKKVRFMLEEIRHAFAVPDDEFERLSSHWLQRLYDWRLHFIGAGLLMIAAWIYVVLVTRQGSLVWFPPEWSEPTNLWVKNIILGIFAVPIALLMVSTGIGFLTYVIFTWYISALPLIPILEVTRIQLRPLSDLSMSAAVAWSVGVSLLVLLFRPAFSLLAVVGVLLLTGVGLLMLVGPQYAIHTSLVRTKRAVLGAAYRVLAQSFPAARAHEFGPFVQGLLEPSNRQLIGLIRSAFEVSTWIYDPKDVASLLGTWLLPLITLAVSEIP